MSEKSWTVISNNNKKTVFKSYEEIKTNYTNILSKIAGIELKNKCVLPKEYMNQDLLDHPFFNIMFKTYSKERIDIRRYFDSILGSLVLESILEKKLSFDNLCDVLTSKGYNPLDSCNEQIVKNFINTIKYVIKDELTKNELTNFVNEKTNEYLSLKENSTMIIFLPSSDIRSFNKDEVEQYNIQSFLDFDNFIINFLTNKNNINDWKTSSLEKKNNMYQAFNKRFCNTSYINNNMNIHKGIHIYSPSINSSNKDMLKSIILNMFDDFLGGKKHIHNVDDPSNYAYYNYSID